MRAYFGCRKRQWGNSTAGHRTRLPLALSPVDMRTQIHFALFVYVVTVWCEEREEKLRYYCLLVGPFGVLESGTVCPVDGRMYVYEHTTEPPRRALAVPITLHAI